MPRSLTPRLLSQGSGEEAYIYALVHENNDGARGYLATTSGKFYLKEL